MSQPSVNLLHLYRMQELGQNFKTHGQYDKVKGQIKITPWRCTPITPTHCPYQVLTSNILQFPRYSPDKIFKLKVPTARSNQGQTMKLRTYNPQLMSLPSINFLHLYGFRGIVQIRFYRSRSLRQGQMSNQDIAHLQPSTNVPTI